MTQGVTTTHTRHLLIHQEVIDGPLCRHYNLVLFCWFYAVRITNWKQVDSTTIEINFTLPKVANRITAILSRKIDGEWLHTLPMDGDARRVYVINARLTIEYTETFEVNYRDGSKDSASVDVRTS